jgi:hypothetical protein
VDCFGWICGEMSCEEMLKLRFVEDGMRMNGKGW